MVQEWTMTAKGASGNKGAGRDGNTRDQGNWHQYTVDLSAYAGQNIYIAFRHNTTGQSWLILDDISVTQRSQSDIHYTITVQSNNPEMGTVSGSGTFLEGTVTTIAATPHSGYRFVQWNDGNTDAIRTITVTANATYTAYFETAAQQHHRRHSSTGTRRLSFCKVERRQHREPANYHSHRRCHLYRQL